MPETADVKYLQLVSYPDILNPRYLLKNNITMASILGNGSNNSEGAKGGGNKNILRLEIDVKVNYFQEN